MVLLLFSMTAYLAVFYIILPFQKKQLEWGLRLRYQWMKLAHVILGIKVRVHGNIPQGGTLVASNHQSALDPLVILRFLVAFPVGKYEIRGYPLIGFAAEKTGVLFVKRHLKDHRAEIKNEIKDHLLLNRSVLLFPEGTVNSGKEVLPLKIGGFQSAVQAQKPVVPICIQYHSDLDVWGENDGLMAHFFKQNGKPIVRVDLYFGPPLMSEDPIELAQMSKKFMERNQFYTDCPSD